MAKIFSKETSPITRSPEDIRILTITACKQPGAKPTSYTAFADTGADGNIIFEDISKRLGLEMDCSERPIINGLGPGQGIRALGKVHLCFRLEEPGECYHDSFWVLPPQKDFDVLLGWPFLFRELGMGYQTACRRRVEKFTAWLQRL